MFSFCYFYQPILRGEKDHLSYCFGRTLLKRLNIWRNNENETKVRRKKSIIIDIKGDEVLKICIHTVHFIVTKVKDCHFIHTFWGLGHNFKFTLPIKKEVAFFGG